MTTQSDSVVTKKTACILCSIKCGLDVQVGGRDGREILKIKGDREHPASAGYLCSKAARLNHYQMGSDRLDKPMRRKSDGTYEAIDWDTAIREVAAGLKKIKDSHGGDKIYLIGGGGQGNHLGALYINGSMKALGIKYMTNALAQEKTGEFWVQGKMFGGGGPHGDFHHTEVAVFVGKNPWQAHGFPQTRKILNDIAKDPARSMVVLDPALTKTAQMADYHLRVKPGTDAWCLSAMIAVIVQEGLENKEFIDAHTDGFDEIRDHFEKLSISYYAGICDLDEGLIRAAARRIAKTKYAEAAGFTGDEWSIGESFFDTLISSPSGFIYTDSGEYADSWEQVGYPDKKIRLHIKELFPQVLELDETPLRLPDAFPFILAAGNRRDTTSNVIILDPTWDQSRKAGSFYINPNDATRLGLLGGDIVEIETDTGKARTHVEISDIQRVGTLALPNGFGIDYENHNGNKIKVGIAPNELTSTEAKDFFAGTPWHKFVPSRIEKVG